MRSPGSECDPTPGRRGAPEDRAAAGSVDEAAVEAMLLVLAAGRRGTFCPSEAARRLADDWRPLMPEIRRVAGRLAREGRLAATQRGAPVDPEAARGPIRLAAAPGPRARRP